MTDEGRHVTAPTGKTGPRHSGGDARRPSLTDEERRLLDFAEVSSDWFYELDKDLRFSLLSSGSSARTGEDPSALLGQAPTKDGLEMVSDEAWVAHLADLASRRAIVDFRFARKGSDGRLRHFSINAKPVFDASGAFAGYRGTGREITRIVDAERFLRDIIDAVPAVIMVRDAASRYVMMNEYYARVLGTTPEEGTGRVSGAFLGEPAAAISRAQDEQVLVSGVPSRTFQREMRISDGSTRVFLVKKVPLTEGAGPPSRVLTVGIDISVLKEAEKALMETQAKLRESEQRFRDFAESSSHWLWELDRELRYTFVSDGARAMTGLSPESYVGARLFDTHTGQVMEPASKRQFLEVLDKREPFMDVPVVQTAADGGIRHLRISGRPFFGEDGRLLGYRGTTRDVTSQYDAEADSERWRQARDVAAAADLAKTRFLANMSHELRTPLNAILGFAEVMSEQLFGELGHDNYREYVRDIGVSGRHLLGIINDLLDMSTIELGQFHQSFEDVALAEIVDEAVRMARGYAQGLGPTIEAEPVEAAWIIHVDRRSIRQILLNLLSNAAKFTPAGRRVGVRVESDRDGNLNLVVADTGFGISAERMATIFEPFQRAAAEHARGGRGAGLGLWLSRSLAELHGGSLEIDSREGEGTIATLTIPLSRIVRRP
ncbi:MAG: PAS domain-containing sensor histidine kinase [Alphaproteobacteria bacterium]|nr:PAS domain-containing sensor histidine kinase [Alphaproteobacteria bacterium]